MHSALDILWVMKVEAILNENMFFENYFCLKVWIFFLDYGKSHYFEWPNSEIGNLFTRISGHKSDHCKDKTGYNVCKQRLHVDVAYLKRIELTVYDMADSVPGPRAPDCSSCWTSHQLQSSIHKIFYFQLSNFIVDTEINLFYGQTWHPFIQT